MKLTGFLAATLSLILTAPALAQQTLLLRQPALSENHLAFVYAGDLWVAERDGTNPRRLTSHPANEGMPIFSPDGTMLAFYAEYEDNGDVYVIPVEGGQPKRLTWHPGDDFPQDWSADGSEVAFVSRRETDHGRSAKLFHAPLDGTYPERQMDARIVQGKYSDDGQLAYIIFIPAYNGLFGYSAGWQGYEGGTAPAINIMSAGRQSVRVIDGADATNFNPFWLGDDVYFISDRENERFNLYRFSGATGALDKLTSETAWDVRAAGGHGGNVVYEAGGRLKQLDIASGEVTELVIDIKPDLPQLRTQWKDASDAMTSAGISATGKRAIMTARGEVFTIPTDEGSTRNLTNSVGTREYTAMWSPDGQQVAWIGETDGGQELVIADQRGQGDVKRFPLGSMFYFLEAWTPGDSPRLIYTDSQLGLYAMDVESGDSTLIASGARRSGFDVSASPDGRWLAYTLERPNYHSDLMLLDFETGVSTQVSDGLANVTSPAFSPDGAYLYFGASTNSGPIQVGLNMTSQEQPYRVALYAAVLAADGESPLVPGAGDEEAAADDGNGEEEEEEAPSATRIDLDGLQDRIVGLPVAERSYGNLQVGKNGDLFYVDYVQPGASVAPPGENVQDENRLMRFDVEDKEASALLSGISGFDVSHGGEHLIVMKTDGSVATGEIGDEIELENVDTSGMRVRLDPREEWVQMFDEAWRMQREYFYADNMHGIDWDAVYEKYRPLVDHAGRREDLNMVIVEMIAELQVGHNRAGGGDGHDEPSVSSGLLGANLETDSGRYRIAKIYTGENWNPFLEAPLAGPGNGAQEGEYILAVNGRDLTAQDNIWEALQGTTGQQVTLSVGPDARGRNARDITVEPVGSEFWLRLWDWVEANRKRVEEATDGRVGYIYLPNTTTAGYTFFNRMFFAQVDKEALIIDERSNGGGQAANYFIEVLSRMHLSGWADRSGMVFNTPAGAVHGPKIMLIDQDAGSGGDYLPWSFRLAGIGTLMGTRTWGGLIGISANPGLMDGGFMVVPFFRFFDPDGNWSVENEGVAPDIEVPLDPVAYNRGEDSQLEAGIVEILRQLEDFDSGVLKERPPLPTELGE